jgi:hypothetical protein
VEAAGIAPASQNPQIYSQQCTCGNSPPRCLHTACTDFGLRELVACWHTLASDVREKIVMLARGNDGFAGSGEEVMEAHNVSDAGASPRKVSVESHFEVNGSLR